MISKIYIGEVKFERASKGTAEALPPSFAQLAIETYRTEGAVGRSVHPPLRRYRSRTISAFAAVLLDMVLERFYGGALHGAQRSTFVRFCGVYVPNSVHHGVFKFGAFGTKLVGHR